MSRMSAELSISVPVSAGVSDSGGSYCTTTGSLLGSRPLRHQSANMPRNTGIGRAMGQLLARKPSTLSASVGAATNPLSQPTTAVTPSWYASGCGMTTLILVPSVVTLASRAVEP